MNTYKFGLLIGTSCLFWTANIFAWHVFPIIHSIDPRKPETTFNIKAESNEPDATLQIKVLSREIDADGNEKETNTKDFFTYPSHLILKSGQKRVVRLIWKGDKDMKEEKAYRFIVEGLPVAMQTPISCGDSEDQDRVISATINLSTRSFSSLYVTPKNSKPNIKCVGNALKEVNGEHFLISTFENQGTQHGLIIAFEIEIESNGSVLKFTKTQLTELFKDKYNILPGHRRTFQLPLPATFPMEFPINVQVISN